MKKTALNLAVVTALCGLAASSPAAENPGWTFEVTPYVWAAGIEGDATVRGQDVDFDKSASDLIDATDIAGSVRLGAMRDRIAFGALIDYVSVSTDELDADDQPPGGVSFDSDMLLTEVMAGYRFDGWAENQSFLVGLGIRNLHLENELDLPGGRTLSQDDDITDALVYVLPTVPVLPSRIDGLRFNPVLGIGAGDSKLAYEMFPQFQYQITETVATRFGYRRVGWKHEDGDNELNVDLAGLILGLGVEF